MIRELEKIAETIPSMGGREIGPLLREYAAGVKPGRAIVEVGSWLGAGTAQMALGVLDAGNEVPIHCYDFWRATASEVAKAARAGVILETGEDTLPLVMDYLADYDVEIGFHQGDIRKATWIPQPIGLYVDDAAKREDAFLHVMQTFSPWFIPNETVVVLMDYYYFEHTDAEGMDFQHRFVTARPDQFMPLGRPREDKSAAIFLYTGGEF
jgi:hypothetical protein